MHAKPTLIKKPDGLWIFCAQWPLDRIRIVDVTNASPTGTIRTGNVRITPVASEANLQGLMAASQEESTEFVPSSPRNRTRGITVDNFKLLSSQPKSPPSPEQKRRPHSKTDPNSKPEIKKLDAALESRSSEDLQSLNEKKSNRPQSPPVSRKFQTERMHNDRNDLISPRGPRYQLVRNIIDNQRDKVAGIDKETIDALTSSPRYILLYCTIENSDRFY